MQRARCASFGGLVANSLLSVWVGPAASISLSLMESGPTPFLPFVGGPRSLHFLRWSRDPLIAVRLSAPPDRALRCSAVRRSRLLRILSRRGGCARNAYRNSACGAKALPLLSLSSPLCTLYCMCMISSDVCMILDLYANCCVALQMFAHSWEMRGTTFASTFLERAPHTVVGSAPCRNKKEATYSISWLKKSAHSCCLLQRLSFSHFGRARP